MDGVSGERKTWRARLGLMGAAALLLSLVAVACHPWYKHLGSIHAGAGQEDFCVADQAEYNPIIDHQLIEYWVKDALYDNGPGIWDWETAPGVDFVYREEDCNDMSPSELGEIELRYRISDTAVAVCDPAPACAMGWEYVCGGSPYGDHTDCDFFDIFIDPGLLTGTVDYRRHVINHESGHAFGLADPTRDVVIPDSAEDCWIALDTDGDGIDDRNVPVVSVMHDTGYCGDSFPPGDQAFPTYFDRLMVELISQNHEQVRDRPD